jgi:hypothetical protein
MAGAAALAGIGLGTAHTSQRGGREPCLGNPAPHKPGPTSTSSKKVTQPLYPADLQTVALIAGSILSCPRFMFYDVTIAVLPFLVALSCWGRLSTAARISLAGCAALFWIGTGFSYVTSLMLGLPLDTFALFTLWLWAVAEVSAGHAGRRSLFKPAVTT